MSSRVQVSLRAFEVFTREIGMSWRPNGLFQFTPRGAGVLSFEHPNKPSGSGRLIETRPDGSMF